MTLRFTPLTNDFPEHPSPDSASQSSIKCGISGGEHFIMFVLDICQRTGLADIWFANKVDDILRLCQGDFALLSNFSGCDQEQV
jgi:hypothetical protein